MENRQLLSITVSTFDDVVDANDTVTSLREAVAQASSDGINDLIDVPAGTYKLDAGLGELAVDDAAKLTIQSVDGTATIDAQQSNRVFSVSARSVVTLQGLAITGGSALDGGGIYNDGSLSVVGSTIIGNMAVEDGGGIYNSATGTLDVVESEVLENSATTGGGIFNASTTTITDSHLADNKSGAWNGGAVFADFNTVLSISGSTLERNSSGAWGGAISSWAATTISNSFLLSNTAVNGGGAIDSFAGTDHVGSLVIDNTTFGENMTSGFGGAIFVSDFGNATISGSTFRGNQGSNGGAIRVNETGTLLSNDNDFVDNYGNYGGAIDQTGQATIIRGIFQNNTAGNNGGGIGNIGTLSVDSTRFVGNDGGFFGGGLFTYGGFFGFPGTVNVINASFEDNRATYGGGAYFEAATVSVDQSSFTGNEASEGGGVRTYYATTSITDTNFAANTAFFGGGAVSAYYYSAMTISGGSITGNSSENGLGGGVGASYYGTLMIDGATISENTGSGVYIQSNNTVIVGSAVADNIGDGVRIDGGYYNTIGTPDNGNTITGNTGAGVAIVNDGYGNSIRGNLIHSNGGLAIDLGGDGRTANEPDDSDYGPNYLQNYPIITGYAVGTTTRVVGRLNSLPYSTFTIDVYVDSAANTGYAEGRRYLGSFDVTTDGQGLATYDVVLSVATVAGEMPTATATSLYGDTSEFSDFSPIIISRASGLLTSESGARDTFSVVLAVQPAATVSIPLSISDGTEGKLSVTSLTFTPANWNVPQIVTVTGVDDTIADGPIGYRVIVGAAVSADTIFSGRGSNSVLVTNLDNDLSPSAVQPMGGLIYEADLDGVIDAPGAIATYTIQVDPGQKITVVVEPVGTNLQPKIELYRLDGKSTLLGTTTARTAGGDAVLQTIATHGALGVNNPKAKTYQIRVSGAGATTGQFRIRYVLNAAVEGETYGGAANDTRAAAQSLESSFLPLASSVTDTPTCVYAGRAAVLGRLENFSDDYYAFTLSAGESATIVAISLNGSGFEMALENSTGNLLALPLSGPTPSSQVVENFVAPKAGKYYVRLGGYGVDYSLVVTRSAAFGSGRNNTIATAQDLNTPEVGARRWAMGAITVGSSYEASAATYAFEDIRATGHAVLQGSDDGGYNLNPADLGGFQFTLFGNLNSYLGISANGYLYLPAGNGYIFAMNRDLVIWSSPNASVYWQVLGTGDQQRLVVQWNEVGFYGRPDADPVTFQVVLSEADGSIQFNYQDLQTGDPYLSEGLDSLVGITAYDPEGNYQSLMLSTSDAPNPLVGTGRSTRLSPQALSQYYKISADAGATLQIETQTPASATGDFSNTLDPIVRLYDQAGNLVASNDNGSSDRRNAKLSYKVPKGKGGTYYVAVAASPSTTAPTQGEYLVSVKGSKATLPNFQVSTSDLSDGAVISYVPSSIQLNFNDGVLLSSLQASDLTVDGVPATSFWIIDGDSIGFALPAGLVEGSHTVAIAAGAIRDLQGTALAAYTSQFVIDLPMFGWPYFTYTGQYYNLNLVTGDINGDGHADLVTPSLYGNTAAVLLGNGDGTFASPILIPTGNYPQSLALGDLTGDGFVDLVISLSSDGVWIYPGDGNGGFGSPQQVGVNNDSSYTTVADVDGNGAIDILIASSDSNHVSVILNDGQGGFSQTDIYAGYAPRSVTVADVNGDTYLDLVVGNYLEDATYLTGGVSVLFGDGTGGFGLPTTYATGGPGANATVGDFDGDGYLDIAATSSAMSNVTVLRNNGDGTFGAPTVYVAGYEPTSIAAADLDGDGLIDVVTTDYYGTVTVLLNVGGGNFSAPTSFYAGDYLVGNQSLAVADFNGDGLLDLAVPMFYSSGISVLLNRSQGSVGMGAFSARFTPPVPAVSTASPVVKLRGKGMANTTQGRSGDGNASFRDSAVDTVLAAYDNTSLAFEMFPALRLNLRRRKKA